MWTVFTSPSSKCVWSTYCIWSSVSGIAGCEEGRSGGSLTFKEHKPGWGVYDTPQRMSGRAMISHVVQRKAGKSCWSWWRTSWRRWELSWALNSRRSFCLPSSVVDSTIQLVVPSKNLEVILLPLSFIPNPNSQELLYLLPPKCISSLHLPTISTAVILGQASNIPLKCFNSLLTGFSLSTFSPLLNTFFPKQPEW